MVEPPLPRAPGRRRSPCTLPPRPQGPMDRSTALLVQRLQEAHALERGLVRTLQNHIAMTPRGDHRDGLQRHLDETRDHADRVQRRLEELGGDDGLVQSAIGAIGSVIGQALALSRAPLDLVRGPGGELKVLENTRDEIAAEAFEIATYETIAALAEDVGDATTATLAAAIRDDEERQLETLRGTLARLARDVVSAEVRGTPVYRVSRTGAADALRTGVRRVRGTAAETRDAAVESAEDAVEQARVAADAAAQQAEKAAKRSRATAKDVARTARGTARKVRAGAQETAEEVVQTAQGAAAVAEERVKETAAEAERTAKRAGRQARKAPEVAAAEGEVRGAVASESDLPIAGYDALNVEDLQTRLTPLTQRELTTVDAYERRNQARKTVLDRIGELRGQEPWSGYDELTVADVLKALRAGDAALASSVADYERRRKGRATILKDAEKRRSAS